MANKQAARIQCYPELIRDRVFFSNVSQIIIRAHASLSAGEADCGKGGQAAGIADGCGQGLVDAQNSQCRPNLAPTLCKLTPDVMQMLIMHCYARWRS